MDLQGLLRDKRVLYVAGIGGAVGLYALWQRKKSGGTGPASAAGANTASGYTGVGGTFDSTGTDVAAYLGQFSGQVQNQLDAWTNTLTGALSGMTPPTPTGAPPANPSPPIWSGPAVSPAPSASHPSFVTVVPFTSRNPPWNSTLSGIAGHTGTTVSALLKLNPGISNPNIIHPGQQIRVA